MTFRLNHAIEILASTPAALRGLLSGLSDEWVNANEGPGTWSAIDVLGHLIYGEETDWIPRLKIILEHGESLTFTPFDREGFRQHSEGQSIEQLLDTFQKWRKNNLQTLRDLKLTDAQLQLTGTHPEFGRVTVSEMLATWAAHDLGHIQQIVRVFAKQYKDDVGPWRKYLSIMKD